MSAQTILFAIVSSDPVVGALIGNGLACRLYFNVVPQETATMPAAMYEIVVSRPDGGMDSAPIADNVRIQVNAYANDDPDAAVALGDAIEAALQNRAAMIANGCGIRLISNDGVDYDDELKRHRDHRDYSFWTSR